MTAFEREFAWQAGFVDGEGCLTIAKQIRKDRPSPAFRPSVTISNTNYRTREHRNGWSDAFTWHCPDNQIRSFLSAIDPFLRSKRPQAKIIMEFINNKKKFKRHSLGMGKGSSPLGASEIRFRNKLWNKIRSLNKKGVYARSLKGGDANADDQDMA